MNFLLLLLPLLTLGTLAQAAPVKVEFSQIARMVMENNQHARGAGLLKQSAELGRGVLFRSYLPKLEARGGGESFKTGNQKQKTEPFGFLEAKWNLFRSGKDKLEDQIADVRAGAASAESDRVLREEIKKSRQAYWVLVSLREMIGILEEAQTENKKNQNAATGRIKAGIATETDRIEFEMHDLELDQELARNRLIAENTERDLAILLGLPEGTSIAAPSSVEHEHTDALLTIPYKEAEHPEVNSVFLRSSEADLERQQLQRWWAPSLDLYGSYGLHTYREREFTSRPDRMESVVGLQLSLNIFDGFVSRTEAQQKALIAEGLGREHEQSSRELRARVDGAKAELKLTHSLIHQSEETLKRAQTYLSRTLDEYRRGVKNSPDVLSAAERNLSARKRFVELKQNYELARAELMSILGE